MTLESAQGIQADGLGYCRGRLERRGDLRGLRSPAHRFEARRGCAAADEENEASAAHPISPTFHRHPGGVLPGAPPEPKRFPTAGRKSNGGPSRQTDERIARPGPFHYRGTMGFRCRAEVRSAAALLALVLAGCAGDGPDVIPQETWLDSIQNDVFNQSCVAGACHNSATRAAGLSLAPGESYAELVDVLPTNDAARSAGLLRVVPGDPGASFLMTKIRGPLGPGEGALMPLGLSALPTAQILYIEAWIAAGASPDAPAPSGDAALGAPAFSMVEEQVFAQSCAQGACHTDEARAGGLSLEADSSYTSLVGVEPSTASARSDGMLLVAPGDPERSFLLNKLDGNLGPGDGAPMHGADPLRARADAALVRAWINAGAHP